MMNRMEDGRWGCCAGKPNEARGRKRMQQGKLAQDMTAQHKRWRCREVRERGCVQLGGAREK